jgi:hypothetical protein
MVAIRWPCCLATHNGVFDSEKGEVTDVRSPNVIQNLSVRSHCGGRQISSSQAGFTVSKKRIEDVAAARRRSHAAIPSYLTSVIMPVCM